MFSNRRAEPGRPAGINLPRSWSLRTRLVVTVVTLLAVVCAGIGIATAIALQRFLLHQLDEQVRDTGRRSVAIFELPPPPVPPPSVPHAEVFDPEAGPGPGFLNAPGQATRTVGAVVSGGRTVDGGVIRADGTRAEISTSASEQLAHVSSQSEPTTVQLDGLGSYRVIGTPVRGGSATTIVTGLPTAVVDDTLLWVLTMFGVVGAIALIIAAGAGIFIIRRQFAPLAEVSAAARQVADLELDRGEVRLPTPIVHVDEASANTEVGQLGSVLNRMLGRIADALTARQASETRVRQFVADASHELRTPLAAIRGYTELVQRRRDALPDDVEHAMDRVLSETERLTHLLEDMLLLARLDSGRPLQREPVDLSALAVDAVSDAHIAGPEHHWTLDLPEEPVVVSGDQARLHQVLANLLTNARVHTPPQTSVHTTLGVDERGAVLLTVTDDGPGIPEALQPEVFERFARGDTSRSRRGGSTGLGLAIVAAVVRAHDGMIEVQSTPGRTKFSVTLPDGAQSTHRFTAGT